MALIKLSGTIGDIQGKIGGAVFSNSGAGLVMKSLTNPVNRNTIPQNNQRILIADLQQQWLLLSTAQRSCWTNWIKLFPIKQNNFNRLNINAQQAFIKVNVPIRLYGHPIIKDPVFTPPILAPVTFFIIKSGITMILNTGRSLDVANEFVELLITFQLSPAVNNPGTKFKSVIFPSVGFGSMFIESEYIAVFGQLPEFGAKVFFKARMVDLITGVPRPFQSGLVSIP